MASNHFFELIHVILPLLPLNLYPILPPSITYHPATFPSSLYPADHLPPRSPKMPLASLPNEILQTIADNLETDSEINQFILTSREIYSRLNNWFYRRNIRQGGWALFDAAYNGRVDTAKQLLRLRADANAKGTHHDYHNSPVRTILGIAVWSEHYEIVKLLLAYAANPNDLNSHGRTPLFFAVQKVNVSLVKLLLEWGADVNVYDFYDPSQCPLDWAFGLEDDQGIVELLLGGGADKRLVESSTMCTPDSPWSVSSGSAGLLFVGRRCFVYLV